MNISPASTGQGGATSQQTARIVCPVVLAGGLSSRMGRDKALLELPNGRTLLAQAKSLFDALDPPAGVEMLPTLVSGARPGGVPDRVVAAGPLGGLQAIADHLQQSQRGCEALLVVPVDMPLLSPALLRQLCVAGQALEQAVCFGDFYLPCWLPLDQRSGRYLEAAAMGNAVASLRALFGYLGCLQLPVPEGDWHLNVNGPQDFERLNL
ncbi:molybdenum cofactor guanylyltransferase [Microbulbifer pacificus]|uniref:NTP transferase domain-containing protein n=1 Tax=Microbulbifer pacificus TaxID=407164 RepID=A0AAU0MWX0_9GAMM|nr:NTP transferase domain-containing protein [Microbulbifer pacificus]WOX04695.1 NTP transferase domain-containing protein [Microbulbifer pacificus]